MPPATRPSLHHIALTVSDFSVSIPWYEKVFGIKHLMDAPHEGGVGKLLADDEFSLVIVLHVHDTGQGERFHETRTGLDHVGISIASGAELREFQAHIEKVGGVRSVDVADQPLTHSAIGDYPYGQVLVFRDPDNIQLEAFAPPGS